MKGARFRNKFENWENLNGDLRKNLKKIEHFANFILFLFFFLNPLKKAGLEENTLSLSLSLFGAGDDPGLSDPAILSCVLVRIMRIRNSKLEVKKFNKTFLDVRYPPSGTFS